MNYITKKILLPIIALPALSSCLNKELPVPRHDPGDVHTTSVSLGEDYKWQVYYSLKNNVMVGRNLKTTWDLGFETAASGWHIILNSSKVMKVYKTSMTNIGSVTIEDTSGLKALLDMPSGSFDSTGIGDWRGGNFVYIIDRGLSESGEHQGYIKIQFLSSDANKYTIRFSGIDESGEKTMDIAKNEQYNFTFLSFSDGGKTLLVEPPKNEWDIAFTQYTHIYYEFDNMPYTVVGCILNRYNTTAVLDTASKNFSGIQLNNVAGLALSSFINTIGFEWKTYTGTTYVVNSNKFYIIRDSRGIYYKLRFTGFYSDAGIKGTPKWEYQSL